MLLKKETHSTKEYCKASYTKSQPEWSTERMLNSYPVYDGSIGDRVVFENDRRLDDGLK